MSLKINLSFDQLSFDYKLIIMLDVPRSDCSYFANIATTIMEHLLDSESFALTNENDNRRV